MYRIETQMLIGAEYVYCEVLLYKRDWNATKEALALVFDAPVRIIDMDTMHVLLEGVLSGRPVLSDE